MQRDIQTTPLFRQAESLVSATRAPGTGQLSEATDLDVSSNGELAVFAGAQVDALVGVPRSSIYRLNLASGETRVLTFGPNSDRLPKISPRGDQVAFLSDRHRVGDFQLYRLALDTGAAHAAPTVDGWVEYLQWSPSGDQVLLGVAAHGADVTGAQGAIATKSLSTTVPSWMPTVETGNDTTGGRRVWILDLGRHEVRPVGPSDLNIWEAHWCGEKAIVVIASPGSGEGLWYSAAAYHIDLSTGAILELYRSPDQLAYPTASPDGRFVSMIEAVCSDRGIVAGDLKLLDISSKTAPCTVDTLGVDVTHVEWRSRRIVLVAGHRAFESVIGTVDVESAAFCEVWSSDRFSGAGRYITVSGFGCSGDCAFIAEGFDRSPEIGIIRDGRYQTTRSFDLGYTHEASRAIGAIEQMRWHAPDGLEIHGWLLKPRGTGPFPLVMNVHGGPVWQWRPWCLARPRSLALLMLLQRGYAIFLPNPRGSSGRGREFIRLVKGDMNGADTQDLLTGVDQLVVRGIADPRRLGVSGVSYGGNMSAWLITQDARFAAAVAISPHTNQVTEHLTSNIPHFVSLFLNDRYDNLGGRYYTRSPISFVTQAKTPTLSLCGALDRCTPPAEALQFHNALREQGVRSVLVTYPEEGHGLQRWPAAIDAAARIVAWFQEHMPALISPD